jgi:hypothetical protein
MIVDIFMEAMDFLFPGMWATIFFLPLMGGGGCSIDFSEPTPSTDLVVFHFLLCSYFNVCSNIKCFHPSVYCV